MKHVVLSADGDRAVYLVPDEAANDLCNFCLDFCNNWLKTSPKAAKYRIGGGYCYDERAFIEYLAARFPDTPPKFVESLGWVDLGAPLPGKYRDCPEFNF